jgi:DNA-binding MarR family transcriptional regulator
VISTTGAALVYIVNLCNYLLMPSPTASDDLDVHAPSAASGDAGHRLGPDLLNVVARINRLATQQARLPLPYAQARLLSTIEEQGEARISDLAALDHCSQPTMTTQVRRLEDSGLVTRTADPGDARAVLISITAKGVRTLTQVRTDRGSAVDPYLARLASADRDTLLAAVRVLHRLLADATTPRSIPKTTPKRGETKPQPRRQRLQTTAPTSVPTR